MQTTNNILLIRPSCFVFNTETAASNAFQIKPNESDDVVKKFALTEFERFAETLKNKGVNVFIFDDTEFPQKPDAIFPNNWITFHPDGNVILYPMYARNRRCERRQDIIDALRIKFEITSITDLSVYEKDSKFLEGTGSIVFDHNSKVAYACLSARTDKELFITVCSLLNYKPVFFRADDKFGKEIYHTNVMMCIGNKFAVVCLDSISDKMEKEFVSHSLINSGHQIIEISFEQMNSFAGNMLELNTNQNKNILVLSQTAFDILESKQKTEIEKFCELVPVSINTIETIGGGSARCMIAEIFLKPK